MTDDELRSLLETIRQENVETRKHVDSLVQAIDTRRSRRLDDSEFRLDGVAATASAAGRRAEYAMDQLHLLAAFVRLTDEKLNQTASFLEGAIDRVSRQVERLNRRVESIEDVVWDRRPRRSRA